MDLNVAWETIKQVCFQLPMNMQANENLRQSLLVIEKALLEREQLIKMTKDTVMDSLAANGQGAADLAGLDLEPPS